MSLHHVPTSDDAWADLLGPAVDATTEGLLVQDAEGIVRASNYAARTILGIPEPHIDSLAGRSPIGPEDRPVRADGSAMCRHDSPTFTVLETGRSQRDVRVGLERAGGAILWLNVNAVPLFAEGSARPYGVVTTLVDVTERVAEAQRHERLAEQSAREHELLEEAHAMAHLGSWAIDLRTGAAWASDGLLRIYGLEPGTVAPLERYAGMVHPEDRAHFDCALAAAAQATGPLEMTYRHVRPDGVVRTMHARSAPADREDGEVTRIWGTTQDVTDLHALEAGRREAEALLRTAFEHAPIGVCVVGLRPEDRGRWLRANPAMSELLGYDADELVAGSVAAFTHPDDLDISAAAIGSMADGTKPRVAVEKRFLHRDGRVIWTLVTSAAVAGADGSPAFAVSQIVDITERKRFEGRLQHLADHDVLTGLVNRRRFEEELERVLAEAERYGRDGAVIVLDLDGFKYVNDTLGHSVGDELLSRLAATLRGELRETDVIARLGGDEFGVILAEADAGEATTVATKLLRAVERDGIVAGDQRHARVTASAGVATFSGGDGTGAEELLVEGDIAMYDAKEDGRNRTVVHQRDPDLAGAGRHVSRLTWLDRVRRALVDDRFELHAQPIVSLTGDDPHPSFELLLRMRGDDDELIPPATFLRVAERFDLMQDIDRWVVARAVDLLRREHEAGRPLTLSVNLSGRTMGDSSFAGWLEDLLTSRPVPAGRLLIEITETAAIVNLDRARALATTLRRLGCRLALDDFGAGFASFSSLKHLDFDVLKIDGEFVRGVRENPTDRLVIEAVVAIARGLGTPSLAEFVTDEGVLEAVRELGVDFAQGFHLGRPVPVEDALASARTTRI
jgi:diguanylate cyclase (GGDEF)-like protein/PAS domain S-box-containing protein